MSKEEFEGASLLSVSILPLIEVVCYDTDRYLEAKLPRIRKIIRESGLRQERIPGGCFWNWKKYAEPD